MTESEMRQAFIDHCRVMIDYWTTTNLDPDGGGVRTRVSGVVHSILTAIGGCSMALPSFDLRVSPHPDDAAYCRENGENWWKRGVDINDGNLNHHLYNLGPDAEAWRAK